MLEMFDDDSRDLKSDKQPRKSDSPVENTKLDDHQSLSESERDQNVDEEYFDFSSFESDLYLSEILDEVYGYTTPNSDSDFQINLANRTDPSGNPYPYTNTETHNETQINSPAVTSSSSRIGILDMFDSNITRDFAFFYKNFDNEQGILDVFDNGHFSLFTNRLDRILPNIGSFTSRNRDEYNQLLIATTAHHPLTETESRLVRSDDLSFAVYVNSIEISTANDFVVASSLVSERKSYLSSIGFSPSQIEENMFAIFELNRLDSFKLLAKKILSTVNLYLINQNKK